MTSSFQSIHITCENNTLKLVLKVEHVPTPMFHFISNYLLLYDSYSHKPKPPETLLCSGLIQKDWNSSILHFLHTWVQFASTVSDTRSGKNKTGDSEDDLENVPPINQSIAMAIAGNPFNTLGRNVLVSIASLVSFSCMSVITRLKKKKDYCCLSKFKSTCPCVCLSLYL